MDERLEKMIENAVSDVDLSLLEIPNIALYLDQILSLVSEKNAEGSDAYKDRVLTKTMINNYSKEGAILPLKGKKYDRSQILQILFIYSLKSTLSIGEIKQIFEAIYTLPGSDADKFSEFYGYYIKMKDRSRNETAQICEEIVKENGLDLDTDEGYMRLVLAIVSLSAYLRTLAETMIAERCPKAPEEKEAEEKSDKAERIEEKKAKKSEKAEEKKARKSEKAEEKKARKSEKKKASGEVKAEAAE